MFSGVLQFRLKMEDFSQTSSWTLKHRPERDPSRSLALSVCGPLPSNLLVGCGIKSEFKSRLRVDLASHVYCFVAPVEGLFVFEYILKVINNS